MNQGVAVYKSAEILYGRSRPRGNTPNCLSTDELPSGLDRNSKLLLRGLAHLTSREPEGIAKGGWPSWVAAQAAINWLDCEFDYTSQLLSKCMRDMAEHKLVVAYDDPRESILNSPRWMLTPRGELIAGNLDC